MVKRIILLILVLITFTFSSKSQQKLSLEFKADSIFFTFSEVQELRNHFYLTPADCEFALQKIKSVFVPLGFVGFNYDSIIYRDNICHVVVYLGQMMYLKNVKIQYSNVTDSALFPSSIYYNGTLNIDVIRNFQKDILVKFNNLGYSNPYLEVEKLDYNLDSVSIVFKVITGELAVFDSLINEGSLKLNYKLLLGLLGLNKGDQITAEDLKLKIAKLNSYDFIESKNEIKLIFKGKKVVVYVNIDKKNNNTFDGIVGLVSDKNNPEKLNLTGNVSVLLNNSFNYAETIGFEWIKSEAESQHLNFKLQLPYISASPIGLLYEFDFYKKDTSFTKRIHRPGISYSRRFPNMFQLFADFENVNFITIPEIIPNTKFSNFDYSSWSVGYKLLFRKYDNQISPLNGYKIIVSLSSGEKKILKNQNLNSAIYDSVQLKSLKIVFITENYIYKQLFNYPVFRFGISAGYISNKNLNQAELFRLGGFKNLRGFDEESILATSYTIFDFETRLPLDKYSYLFIFGTKSVLKNSTSENQIYNNPYSFGTGLSIQSNIGLFSIVYALGSQFNQPIQFRSSKVHFGYLTRF